MTLTVVRPGLSDIPMFPELPFPLKLELHPLLSQRAVSAHGRAVSKHHQRQESRTHHFHHGISLSFPHRTWSSRIPFLPSWSPFWKGSCSGMWARGLDAKEEGRCCLLLGPLPWKISTSLSMSEFISSKNLLPVVRILILEREHYKVLLHGITFQIPSFWTCFLDSFCP